MITLPVMPGSTATYEIDSKDVKYLSRAKNVAVSILGSNPDRGEIILDIKSRLIKGVYVFFVGSGYVEYFEFLLKNDMRELVPHINKQCANRGAISFKYIADEFPCYLFDPDFKI